MKASVHVTAHTKVGIKEAADHKTWWLRIGNQSQAQFEVYGTHEDLMHLLGTAMEALQAQIGRSTQGA
jgi:hypothetical protein